MSKDIIWVTLIVFSVFWFACYLMAEGEVKKEACLTRLQMYCAASLIVLCFPD